LQCIAWSALHARACRDHPASPTEDRRSRLIEIKDRASDAPENQTKAHPAPMVRPG